MGARILVADDSVTIQKVVELTLSKEDFVLIPVRSGEEAIRKAKEVQPDLILLDLVMPDKNGYEVCTALRAEPVLRSVPIIMLTGTFEAFDKEQGLRAGANDFLTKPFESQTLISRVKQLLFARTVDLGGPAAPAPAPPVPGVQAPPPPAPATPAKPGEPPTLELPGLELEPIPDMPKTAGADASRIPQSLSLDELLEPGPVPPLPATPSERPSGVTADSAPDPTAEPTPIEALRAEGEAVFDLTAEVRGPSLPLVEVGKGEPPELAIGDLLRPPGAAPIESGIEVVPELPIEPLVDSRPEPTVPSPEVPPALELAIEVPPEPHRTAAPPPGPVEIGDLVQAAPATPPVALMAEILATPAPYEAAETPPVPPPQTDVTLVPPPPPVGPEMAAAPPSALLAPEMEVLRQAVTERVVHELAKEVSSQLVERIERIVWEVVPDLAEILINREIERLRTIAEGKQPS